MTWLVFAGFVASMLTIRACVGHPIEPADWFISGGAIGLGVGVWIGMHMERIRDR